MATKEGCIFCDIGAGKSPANIEFEDNKVIAFWDVDPKSPIHILITPKDHLTWKDLSVNYLSTLGWMDVIASRIAEKKNLSEDGYRLVLNNGPHGGQIVEHIHLHLLGGRQLGAMG